MSDWKAEIRGRLQSLRLTPARADAIVEELAQYLDECYEELLAGGATETEAYQRTLTELDGSELLAHELRAMERQAAPEPIVLGTNRRTNMISDLWQDLLFGARMLLKRPGFTAVAVVTLALGIGANTAMFSVVNDVLLRPLPFPDPDRLTLLTPEGVGNFAAPDFRDVATQNRSFERVGAYSDATFNLAGGSEPERVIGARVSAGLLTTLGVRLLYGRDLTEEEEREGAARVVLLGQDRKSTRLNSSHLGISYAVFCLKKKNKKNTYT